MTTRPLRVGLVGVGRAAELFHLPAIASRPQHVELVGVADPSSERLDRAQELTGLAPSQMHRDAMDLIRSDDIDIVDFVIPPHVRKDYMIAAAVAGRHIMCEKPLAVRPADAVDVVEAVEAAGVTLATVHNWLLFPEIRRLGELVAGGELGHVRAAFVDLMGMAAFPGTSAYSPAWRSDPAVSGGGVLMDMVHTVYLVEFLLGRRIRRVNAYVSASEGGARVEDFAGFQVETDANVGFVNIALGRGSSSFEILGSEGAARAAFEFTSEPPGRGSSVSVTTSAGERTEDLPHVPGQWTAFSDTVAGLFVDLVESIEEGRRPVADGREAIRMLEVALAAYQSAATGERVTVPLRPDNPLYAHGVTAVDRLPLDELSAVSRQVLFSART